VMTANGAQLKSQMAVGAQGVNQLGVAAKNCSGIMSSFTGILGAVGLGFSLWSGFAKAGESEQAVSRLNAVVKSTGGLAGFSGDQLQKMAGDMSAVTTFSRTAVVSGEAVLATFTNIRGDQFKEAMTAAENLSTVLGQDLQTSVVQVGKALNDPEKGYTALKRAGVSFTASQIDQIKTLQASGNILGAQKILLKELSTEFGGAAEAAGATFSNQIDKAKGSIGAIASVIASGMLPGLASMAHYLKAGADFAREHKAGLQGLGKGILVVITAIAAYKTAMGAIVIAQKAWQLSQAATLALEGPGGWAILAGAALATAGAYVAITKASEQTTAMMGDATGEIAKAREQMDGLEVDGEGAADGVAGVGKAAKTVAAQVEALNASLRQQLATFGMSSAQADVYKLQMAGATDASLALANALTKELEFREQQKKAVEELAAAEKQRAKDAAAVLDDLKSPMEKVADEIARISNLEDAGLLNSDQAEAAVAKFSQGISKAQSDAFKKQKMPDFGKNAFGEKTAALERRFTSGFERTAGAGIQEKLLAEAQLSRKAAEQTAKNTKPDDESDPSIDFI
jgi:hypothetical protein